MSIDRLRYFSAVVETRNLRKAAELVRISSPSMSKAISLLEKELGCKLLYPEGRGIGITSKGLEIYRKSATLLDEYHRFYQGIRTKEESSQALRIATYEVFSSYFLSAFLEREKKQEVLLLEMTPGRLEQAILTGLVDYGITYLPSPDPALSYQEIGSFQFANYGTEKWLKKSFEDWEYAVPVTELKLNSIGVASLDMWPSSGPPRCIKYKFELLETALQMARTGNAVIHCPNFIIRLQNNFCKPEYQLHELATPSGYGMSRLIKVFLVSKKGMANKNMEGKFARFMRSIKV